MTVNTVKKTKKSKNSNSESRSPEFKPRNLSSLVSPVVVTREISNDSIIENSLDLDAISNTVIEKNT